MYRIFFDSEYTHSCHAPAVFGRNSAYSILCIMHPVHPILSYSILCTRCSLSCPTVSNAPDAAYPVLYSILCLHPVQPTIQFYNILCTWYGLSCPTVNYAPVAPYYPVLQLYYAPGAAYFPVLQYIIPGASYPVLQYIMHQMQPIMSYSILCTRCSLSCPIVYYAPDAPTYSICSFYSCTFFS